MEERKALQEMSREVMCPACRMPARIEDCKLKISPSGTIAFLQDALPAAQYDAKEYFNVQF